MREINREILNGAIAEANYYIKLLIPQGTHARIAEHDDGLVGVRVEYLFMQNRNKQQYQHELHEYEPADFIEIMSGRSWKKTLRELLTRSMTKLIERQAQRHERNNTD